MDEQFKALVANLTDKTNASKLHWDKTSRDNEFICTVGSGSITVDNYWAQDEWNGEQEQILDICILNSEGQQIDRQYYEDGSSVEFKMLLALHKAVYRKYHRIDEVIHSIINDISNL